MSESLFTEIFDLMDTAVYIVTADDGERKGGCTVVWVSRASFEPSYVAVFVAPKRYTHDIIAKAQHFCLNIVGENRLDLAKSFGMRSSYDVDKFANLRFNESKSGAPILQEACAYLDCKLVQEFTVGDHTCFIGEVLAAEKLSMEKPLLYEHSDYYTKEAEIKSAETNSQM